MFILIFNMMGPLSKLFQNREMLFFIYCNDSKSEYFYLALYVIYAYIIPLSLSMSYMHVVSSTCLSMSYIHVVLVSLCHICIYYSTLSLNVIYACSNYISVSYMHVVFYSLYVIYACNTCLSMSYMHVVIVSLCYICM